jgi:D-alanine-D-alanine ligase
MMDEALVPPVSIEGLRADQIAPFKTELDVLTALRSLGHDAQPIGVRFDLNPLHETLAAFKPDVCFNLVEDFHGTGTFDQHVVSYLELLKQPYTGSNPRGLTLARDKALTKKILAYHQIPVPRFHVFPAARPFRRPPELPFPLLVKSLVEEGSVGISQSSVVYTDAQLADRVAFIHEHTRTDAIAEQYIEGRELYVSVLGNRQLTVFPTWELDLSNLPDSAPRIATRRIKMDRTYQDRYKITSKPAELTRAEDAHIADLSRQIYRLLNLSGYARLDLRLTPDGHVYLIEANPNPQIARNEDFADSAAAAGIAYEPLLQKILTLGLNYQPLGLAA